jgi:hypothetical protein
VHSRLAARVAEPETISLVVTAGSLSLIDATVT